VLIFRKNNQLVGYQQQTKAKLAKEFQNILQK
jgi:hypothetical protein